MYENIDTLTIGTEVWWNDPEGKSSGPFKVVAIKYEEDEGLYDDTIVLISNGKSEAEVEAWELQDLTLHRQKIKELVDRVTDIVAEDDWSVHNHDESYDKIDLYFSKYSTLGQDFGFYVEYDSGDVNGLINTIEAYYESYDPSEEASYWIGDDGHGKNGAPYDLADILEDMKECKNNIRGLIDLLNMELRGWKAPQPILHQQYSEQMLKTRTEIVNNIYRVLKNICNYSDTFSVLWSSITENNLPEVCCMIGHDSWSALPSTIELDEENSKRFIITFASFEDCPNSSNGENVSIESLIEILSYLENYYSKL